MGDALTAAHHGRGKGGGGREVFSKKISSEALQ
jgi:hypothetical protein